MSDLPEREDYLGDGLYVAFDGYGITLRAPRENGDHVVCLEPEVYQSLRAWLARFPRVKEHMEGMIDG